MTDHRVTDLAIGHPGRATYDPEEQEWKFSQTLTEGATVKQLVPFKEWIPPSNHPTSRGDEKASVVILNQTRWLSKTLPETVPAKTIASSLLRSSWDASSQNPNDLGSILAIGRAHDAERVSGIRRPHILAVPSGAAGHVLRLIKPRIETRGWGKSSGARLSFFNLESLDTGHWMGTGGTIRQIIAADDNKDKDCWLAVRQATVITLFRPKYGKLHANLVQSSTGHSTSVQSMLNANPVVSLTAQRTGSKTHSDVAFNPWFSRQFAVIDTLGYWSIWEVDVRYNHGKNSSPVLVPKKTGGIYDGQAEDESLKVLELVHFDGWYRVLWAGNLNTVVVCNRRHIIVFDVKAQTKPLGRANIFPVGNTDWILDIQRCNTDMNYLYVLTTSRIFWMEIIPGGERYDDQLEAGCRTILSYVHFMSPDDETLKLTPLKSDNVSVAITSAKNRVVNYYVFQKPQTGAHASSKGTFSLFASSEKTEEQTLALHTVNLLPCRLVPSVNHYSGPGPKYIEDGVEFFQLWAVTADLGLFSTLTAIHRTGTKEFGIVAPDTKLLLSSRVLGPKYVNEDNDFIAPDNRRHSKIFQRSRVSHAGIVAANVPAKDDLHFRLNWRKIFRTVFDETSNGEQPNSNPESDLIPGFPELLRLGGEQIMQRKEQDEPLNVTLAELIGATKRGEDLEDASPTLGSFLESLQQNQSPQDRWRLVVKDLTLGTEVKVSERGVSIHPELLKIFDQLIDYWMGSLPNDLPNIVRHAKFKVIRQLAMDLCLNSIGISLQDNTLEEIGEIAPVYDETVTASAISKDGRLTRESSPLMLSSQLVATQDEPGLTLPTPTQTPSLYSQATSASGIIEDPVIARLRQYAPTIKAKSDLITNTNLSVLSHWPSALADPAEYSYEAAKKAWAAANTDEEDARSSRKEKARRRRRTEEFVKAVEPAVSRRLTLTSGSQPEAMGKMFSSQPDNDIPMTQPDRGTFGSRTVQQVKKKPKKQRIAGFK
ncbi:RNA polymerase I-specific transcription initiation factor RRN6-like protein [Rhexocercosporidium sp. MPI-PUGE-AT-0058]|nr:RNA polymerase I-specific transcription initiation factor RRN6-like protein [Rhexocercosporidium sp. MPI-PUGE-AT-0058]